MRIIAWHQLQQDLHFYQRHFESLQTPTLAEMRSKQSRFTSTNWKRTAHTLNDKRIELNMLLVKHL